MLLDEARTLLEALEKRYNCPLLAGLTTLTKCPFCKWQVPEHRGWIQLTAESEVALSPEWVAHAWETHGALYLGLIYACAERVFRCPEEADRFQLEWTDLDRLHRMVSRPGPAGLRGVAQS
jgi:hypothetical protein